MSYTKLTNFVYRYFFLQNLMLCLGLFFATMAILPSFAAGSHGAQAQHAFLPYESIIYLSYLPYVFLGALLLQALLTSFRCTADFTRTGGADQLLLLPCPKRTVVCAFVTAGMLGVLMLYAAQALGLLAAYPSVVSACEAAAAASGTLPMGFPVERVNGLFLAMLRSDLFHILLPQSLPEALHTCLILLALGGAPAVGLFGPNGPVQALLIPAFMAGLAIYVLSMRGEILARGAYGNTVGFTLMGTIWLLLLLLICTLTLLRATAERERRRAK